jgi:restriction endonuclease S subunit
MSEAPIAAIADVNPPLPQHVRDEELVSFVRMADVKEGGGLASSADVRFGSVKFGFTRFAEGDVIFAKITPCMENGKGALATSLTNGIGCGSTEFHVLRAKGDACPAFIYQVLQSKWFRQKAEMNMSGSAGQQRVPSSFFSQRKVFIPEPSQQRRIAEILSTVDEAIEQTEALIAKYQQIKAGLMQDLFTRGLSPEASAKGDVTWTLRPTHAQAPHLYKESPLGWIPKEWSAELLDRLSLRGSGHTPNKNQPDFWNGGIKWVSLADSWRLDRLYISETDKEISQLGIENSSAVLHPPGIVVLSRDAGVGKSAITTCSMAVSQHFMCWRCGPQLDNHYLYYWLQYRKREFENIATGSTIPTIGLRFFKYYRINVPTDIEEQRHIGSALLSADHTIFSLETDVGKLRQQKQGLMQDLLTGRVRVKVGEAEEQS